MKKNSGFILGIGFLIMFVMTGTVLAQEPEPSDDEVNAIAKQLYCPVCENIPLDVCSTQACSQWRETIREKLSLGWNEEQIKQYFAAQYGDRVLATPPVKGLNWLVYVLPPVAIILGGVFVFRAFRSWTHVREGAPIDGKDETRSDDPYVRQLEEELRRREEG
jgi:cytochrome c-type biogenesis protein CcmH